MINDDFIVQVQSILGPALSRRGFALDEIDNAVDEGGRYGAALYFRGRDCKLQVYWSAREWEINSMIAPLDAPNEHGLYNRSGKWHYLNSFSPMPDLSLEDLVKKQRQEHVEFEDDTRRLQRLVGRIESFYDEAHAGVLKLYG